MTLENFIENYLPEQVFSQINQMDLCSPEAKDIDNILKDIWSKQNSKETLKISEDFSFIHSVRLARSSKTNEFIKIFLLKSPFENTDDEHYVSAAFLFTNKGVFKFFGFKELDDKIVPPTYINKNQKYLLYEIDKTLNFKNWGALINTRNLNEITQSILLASGF